MGTSVSILRALACQGAWTDGMERQRVEACAQLSLALAARPDELSRGVPEARAALLQVGGRLGRCWRQQDQRCCIAFEGEAFSGEVCLAALSKPGHPICYPPLCYALALCLAECILRTLRNVFELQFPHALYIMASLAPQPKERL